MTDINIAGEDCVPPPPRPSAALPYVYTHPRRSTVAHTPYTVSFMTSLIRL